jgi:endoglucanase
MKYLNVFSLLFSLLIMGTSCSEKESVSGKWYGLYQRSLVTFSFNDDHTLDVKSESFSSLSFSCKYALNESSNPMEIDLTESTNGMAGAGLVRINADKTMEFFCNFGAPGVTERPAAIESQPKAMTNIYFKLSKHKESVLSEIAVKTKAPESAKLAFERNARLGAGINLNAVVDGNLHPGYERDAPLGDDEIRSIADVGFRSIRLNVTWAKHSSKKKPYTIDPDFFDKVDHIVNESLKNGLSVSIDMHYYPYINMEHGDDEISYEENYERLNSFWEQIAEHYKNYPPEVYFDLLNEPNLRMGADKWNEVIARLAKTIRKTNPDRTLIVNTPNLGQSWTLNYLELPADDWNIIVQFHYYLPHLFTHQGLASAMAENSSNVEWLGTDEEKAAIESDLDFCLKWSKANGRPINMGEYGVVNTADVASRARYLGFMREASAKRGISSHLWGYREIFQICDEQTGEWIQPILDAMKLKDQ